MASQKNKNERLECVGIWDKYKIRGYQHRGLKH